MIQVAISTCPNDTFAFHAILENKVGRRGLAFDIALLDIQQLNAGLLAGEFDIAKASFHAAAKLADRTVVLPSGSALGFGVGPLLLAADGQVTPENHPDSPTVTLCPGPDTTATMLFQMFHSGAMESGNTRVDHCVFSDIMPALQQHRADFGVCIHEGRFTWQQQGLYLVEDLGQRWEQETDCPLPLGGILASRSLDDDTIGRFQAMLRESIEYANQHRDQTRTTMRKYAQEFDDEVLFQHVDLYVNEWTVDLGDVGARALHELARRAKDCGLIQSGQIEVWKV